MNFKEVRDLLKMMNVDMNEHHALRLFTVIVQNPCNQDVASFQRWVILVCCADNFLCSADGG